MKNSEYAVDIDTMIEATSLFLAETKERLTAQRRTDKEIDDEIKSAVFDYIKQETFTCADIETALYEHNGNLMLIVKCPSALHDFVKDKYSERNNINELGSRYVIFYENLLDDLMSLKRQGGEYFHLDVGAEYYGDNNLNLYFALCERLPEGKEYKKFFFTGEK